MKRQLSFGLIVLALASLACQVTLTPRPTPPPLPTDTPTITLTPTPTETATPTITPTPPLTASGGPVLLELHMFSATRGWGLTENQILITRNGGIGWAQVPLPGVTFGSSVNTCFISADIAYFFAPIPGAKIGQFLATRDGGATWKNTITPFTNAKLYFLNDNAGFALQTLDVTDDSMAVAIYQTLDHGENWLRVFPNPDNLTDNLPDAGIKTGISFISADQGFIGLRAQNSIGFYSSPDSGHNWTKQDLALPVNPGDQYQSTVWPPVFFPANTTDGFLAVDFVISTSDTPTRAFYVTHDSGATWEKGGNVPYSALYFFADSQNGWTWSGHSLYVTNDGAKTWNQSPAAFDRSEHASLIDFADSQNGWLATIDTNNVMRLYRTSDSGGTWTALSP